MSTNASSSFTNQMSPEPHHSYLPPALGKITHIQTFLPSHEYIRKTSVLAIEVPDDLNDGRLGISDLEDTCHTCDSSDCAGHNAHMESPVPVPRIFCIKRQISIFNCICVYCHQLRIPKSDPKYQFIKSLPQKMQLQYLVKYSSAFKRCGGAKATPDPSMHPADIIAAQQDGTFKGCGKLFVNFRNEDKDAAFVRAIIPLDDTDYQSYLKDSTWRPPDFSPEDLCNVLELLDDEVKEMTGSGENNDTASLYWRALPIPSINTRPSHTFAGIGVGKRRIHNDWTKMLRVIVSTRNELQQALDTSTERISCCIYSLNDIEAKDFRECFRYGYLEKKARDKIKKRLKEDLKKQNLGVVENCWRNLTKQIAAFQSHKHKKYFNKGSTYGRPVVNAEERYKGQKSGRFRQNIVARRVNNSMRGVLDGDIYLRPDEVGVPISEAMIITQKVYKTAHNVQDIQKWILNGAFVYPGANYVTLKNGVEKDLSYKAQRRDINLDDVLFVRRHLIDGDTDPCLGNRQPTLHRLSMLTHKVKVIPGYAIKLHPAVFTGYAADCDGDEFNLHFPQTEQAKAELLNISTVENNVMKDGKVWIKFIQNPVIASYLLSRRDMFFTKAEAMQLLMCVPTIWSLPEPTILKPKELWTGKQLIAALMPGDFTCSVNEGKRVLSDENFDEYQADDNGRMCFQNGEFLYGRLNDSMLNGTNGLISHLYRDYSNKTLTIDFIYHGYIMFQHFLDHYGLSAGFYDVSIDDQDVEMYKSHKANIKHENQNEAKDENKNDSKDERQENGLLKAMERIEKVQHNVNKLRVYGDGFKFHHPSSQDVTLESNLREHIDKLTVASTDAVYQYHKFKDRNRNSNGLLHMIESGAKGSKNTLNQMCGPVNYQVYVNHARFESSSSHFKQGNDQLCAYGLITTSYSDGVELPGFISEAHATCESIVNKNKGTSHSGYTVRKLTTCMMGIVADYTKRVMDTNGKVLWNLYGDDGFDPATLSKSKIRVLCSSPLPSIDILTRFASFEKYMKQDTLVEWKLVQNTSIAALEEEMLTLAHLAKELQDGMMREGELDFNTLKHQPIDFQHLFERCRIIFSSYQNLFPSDKWDILKQIDLTPIQFREFNTTFWKQLCSEKLVFDSYLPFKVLFFDWLSTTSLLEHRINKVQLKWLTQEIIRRLAEVSISPGESVGTLATQCTGEPFTQMSLKTPHLSGKFSTVVSGTTRIKNIVDGNFCNPMMTITLKESVKTKAKAQMIGLKISRCYIRDVSSKYPEAVLQENECVITLYFDTSKIIKRVISLRLMIRNLCRQLNLSTSMFDIPFIKDVIHLKTFTGKLTIAYESEYWKNIVKALPKNRITGTIIAENILHNLFNRVVIQGLHQVENFVLDQLPNKRWCISTLGSNLKQVLKISEVDPIQTHSNDSSEMMIFGLVAARKSLFNEFKAPMGGLADDRHINTITRMMTSNLSVQGMKVEQIGTLIPPLQRASFEKCIVQAVEYCSNGEIEKAQTICGAAMTNKLMNVGTGYGMDLIPVKIQDEQKLTTLHRQNCGSITPFAYAHQWPLEARYFLTCIQREGGEKLITCTDTNFNVYQGEKEDEKGEVKGDVSNNVNDALFRGTVFDGYTTTIDSKQIFIIQDILLVAGNKCSILRYDQRIEIAREALYRLALKEEGASSYQTWFKVDELAHHELLKHQLPITSHAELSNGAVAIPGFNFLCMVSPLFNLKALSIAKPKSTIPSPSIRFSHLGLPAQPFHHNKLAHYIWNSEIEIEVMVEAQSKHHNRHDLKELSQYYHPRKGEISLKELNRYRKIEHGQFSLWVKRNEKVAIKQEFEKKSSQQTPYLFLTSVNTIDSKMTIEEGQFYNCIYNALDLEWKITPKRAITCQSLSRIIRTIQSISESIQPRDFQR